MLNCLSLLQAMHWLEARHDGMSRTACGLAVSDAVVTPGMFTQDTRALSCPRCASALARAPHRAQGVPGPHHTRPAAAPAASPPPSLAARLLQAIATAAPERLGLLVADEMLSRLSATRIARLHELFPSWHATLIEEIAAPDSSFVRYAVACTDRFGLIGEPGPVVRDDQAMIVRLQGGRVADVQPVVDAFSLWSRAASFAHPPHPASHPSLSLLSPCIHP